MQRLWRLETEGELNDDLLARKTNKAGKRINKKQQSQLIDTLTQAIRSQTKKRISDVNFSDQHKKQTQARLLDD